MSLISQKDREVAIKALESYASEVSTADHYLGKPEHSPSEVYALLNWVKLQYEKNKSQGI